MYKKSIVTAFVTYCDSKHSDILQGSSHVRCCFFLNGCGQRSTQSVKSWNSKVCYIYELVKWTDCLDANTNLEKVNVYLIIIGWLFSEMW